MILKLGSKGEDVKTLQMLLNSAGYAVSIDSTFGPKTEAAVKAFQKDRGLEVDGIAGSKTMAAFTAGEIAQSVHANVNPKCVDPSVIYAPLTSCITKMTSRKIKYLAIHYTAGGSSAPGRAKIMKASWEKTKRASADFGVDDRDCVQFNPDILKYRCWSVGDKKNPYSGGGQLYGIATNSNTISIEICSNLKAGFDSSKVNHEGWYFTEASLNNAVKLAKILMRKYNIPIERVVRHYDISGKVCPGVIGWNNAKNNNSEQWLAFKKRLV